MENSTDFYNAFFMFSQGIWIFNFVLVCLVLMISLYLFVALAYHQIKVEEPMKSKFFQMTLEKKYRVLSKYSCIVIGVFLVIRSLGDIGISLLEWNAVFSNESVQPVNAAAIACSVLSHFSASAFVFGNLFVYVYLWLRQSIFYVQSTLKVLYNRKIKAFSVFILVFYLVSSLSICIAFTVLARIALNKAGFCMFQANPNIDATYIKVLTAWNSLSIAMQILLLGLFVYPLLKQASWNKNQLGTQNHRMLRVVKKAVILASVCLVTDICALIYLNLSISSGTYYLRTNTVYGVNAVINYLVAIACFGYWRKLLWPWSLKC